jgi:hypothetical protein
MAFFMNDPCCSKCTAEEQSGYDGEQSQLKFFGHVESTE